MSSVRDTIAARKNAGSGALIGYLPIGFPDLQTSIDAAVALVDSGVDILELGLPYSDPVMDGTAIQKATQQALARGFRLHHGIEAVEAISARTGAPMLVMTYWNPIVQYGVDRFATDLKNAGGAGLITPDLIPDEAAGWFAASDATDLDRVFLAAPSSTDERLAQSVESSRGFVYAVSTMGITGARADVDKAARGLVSRLRSAGASIETTPACVGVGISTPDQVTEVLGYADGAIVGSALVTALAEGGVAQLGRTASALAAGTTLS
ncbi:tryptophan synthase subunit alpha [soil metagenome]